MPPQQRVNRSMSARMVSRARTLSLAVIGVHEGDDLDMRTIKLARNAPLAVDPFCDNSVANSKYTPLTFVPKAIFEQFRKLANCYFLFMGGLMLLGTYSTVFQTPLTAFTTLFPLAVVLAVSMIQEGFADIKRHRADDETNNRLAKVTSYKTGRAVTSEAVRWRDIRVGDLVYVRNKQPLPADVVILATSGEEHVCYIETSSIDGETNLKLRRAVGYAAAPATAEDVLARLEADRPTVLCDIPNQAIESFTGTVNVTARGNGGGDRRSSLRASRHGSEAYDRVIPIDNDNVLLRGAVLRNTEWAIGVAVYTGKDSKLQRNARQAPSKMSKIDVLVNKAILLILATDIVLVLAATLLLLGWELTNFPGLTYLGFQIPGVTPDWAVAAQPDGMQWATARTNFIAGFLTFFVLFNNAVPISMYVTLEMINFLHISLINNDLEMYHAETDTPAKARTNVITDLGQIDYVFSDKTGTLTQNLMRFKRASIAGRVYGAPVLDTEANAELPYVNLAQMGTDAALAGQGAGGEQVDDYLKVLALCHTVVVEKAAAGDDKDTEEGEGAGGLVYQAESPDEKALVSFAREAGYELVGRAAQQITLRIRGRAGTESWTPLAVNKFDSTRKRMSVVVRNAAGRLRLLCKGADSSMLPRGSCATQAESEEVVDHLKTFSQEGLRTLVLGYRDLTEAQFEEWMGQYRAAAAATKDRAELLSQVADDFERDMRIVGVTAIEDKLQDGVGQTIADLAEAGIKVCVLTGDKLETAINIGISTRVLRQDQLLLQLTSGSATEVEACLARLLKAIIDKKGMPKALAEAAARMDGDGQERRAPARAGRCSKGSPQEVQALSVLRKHYPTLPMQPQRQPSSAGAAAAQNQNKSSSGAAVLPIHVRFTEAVGARNPLSRRRSMSVIRDFAFIMEGPALLHVLGNEALEVLLFEAMKACSAVIACRVSPKQKAQLVRLVKEKKGATTLAIGDGANDVGMILEAHVGVGISGNEGQQAVNASDFAIAQFRFLKRLLLLHGRWDYRRISRVVLYSFYKNLALVVTLFLFLLYCGFSGTPLYEDFVLSGFNFFLGLPIITLGVFDQDVPAAYALANPKLYVSGRKNLDLNGWQVARWIVSAVLHGALVFYLTVFSAPTGGVYSETDYAVLGLAAYTVLLTAMQLRVFLEVKTITRPALLPTRAAGGEGEDAAAMSLPPTRRMACALCGWSLWVWLGSGLSIFFVALVYNNMLSFSPAFFGVANATYALSSVWLQLLLVPIACMAVEVAFVFVADEFFPDPVQLGIEDAWLVQQQQQQPAVEKPAPAASVDIEMGEAPRKGEGDGGDAGMLPAMASVVPAN